MTKFKEGDKVVLLDIPNYSFHIWSKIHDYYIVNKTQPTMTEIRTEDGSPILQSAYDGMLIRDVHTIWCFNQTLMLLDDMPLENAPSS